MRSCIKKPLSSSCVCVTESTSPTSVEKMTESTMNSEGKFYPNITKVSLTSPQSFKRKDGLTTFSRTVLPSLFFKCQK